MAEPTSTTFSADLPKFVVKNPVEDAEKLGKTDFSDGDASGDVTVANNNCAREDDQAHAPSDEEESDNEDASRFDNLSSDETQQFHAEAMGAKDEGNVAFRNESYDKAIEFYSTALSNCSPTAFAKDCAALYSNRAAAKLKLKMYTAAVQDCKRSIDLDKHFTRAYFRRATAFEALEKYEEASKDYQEVLKLDPTVREAGEALQRIPKLIEERNERLKTEMFGKLKQLGNSILRPFGMSVNNFKLEQGSEGSGYSVKYDPTAKPDAEK